MRNSRVKVNHRSRKPRKDSKTIPVHGSDSRGDGKDSGKYYECWHCGFICDVDRDALGDSQSIAQITNKSYDLLDEFGDSVADTGGCKHTIFEGEGYTTNRYVPVVESGCPFCGTKNYRGDY